MARWAEASGNPHRMGELPGSWGATAAQRPGRGLGAGAAPAVVHVWPSSPRASTPMRRHRGRTCAERVYVTEARRTVVSCRCAAWRTSTHGRQVAGLWNPQRGEAAGASAQRGLRRQGGRQHAGCHARVTSAYPQHHPDASPRSALSPTRVCCFCMVALVTDPPLAMPLLCSAPLG